MKKTIAIVLALLILAVGLSACGRGNSETPDATDSLQSSSTTNTSNTTEDTPNPTEKNQSGVNIDDSIISWANMKIDNPDLNLTEEQKAVVKYFDKDYFWVGDYYENLQKYPKAFRNAQISFLGQVKKIISADDDSYECLINTNGWGEPHYLIIKGKQGDARIIEGDAFQCYGRYIDVMAYEIDGKSYQLPVVSINFTVPILFGWGMEVEMNIAHRYDLKEITMVSKAIFGNDIKISDSPTGWELPDSFEWPDWNDPHYFITLDNQSNSNFQKFMIAAIYPNIVSLKSTYEVKHSLSVSADFNHYIISIFDTNINRLYLEYYDRDFKKIWGREFDNVESVPYDYTADKIYLVAGNDLYIIDTKTGEDVCSPILVGEKVHVSIMQDGVVLVGKGKRDNIMKTDLEGKIIWKVSTDLFVDDCLMMQIVDGNIVAQLYGNDSKIYSIFKFVVVDKDGNIILDFIQG